MRILTLAILLCAGVALSQLNISKAPFVAGVLKSSAAGDSFSGTTFYVNTGSAPGGDGSTTNTSGATRAFGTLYEALRSTSLDISQPRRIKCYGANPDVTNCTQTTWDSVSTTAANYLEVIGDNWTPGIYNTSAYRMETTNGNCIYNNNPAHVRIINLQFRVRSTTSSGNVYQALRLSTANVGSGVTDADCRIDSCIVDISMSGSDDISGCYNSEFATYNANNKMRIFNTIVYSSGNSASGFTYGFGSVFTNVTSYNCTAYGCDFGFIDPQRVYNCLAASCTYNDFESVTVGGIARYNAATGTAPGVNSRSSQTFTFVNTGAFDFHLQSGDAGAKNFGETDPSGGLFSDDIDGQTRSGSWDIGADEQQ